MVSRWRLRCCVLVLAAFTQAPSPSPRHLPVVLPVEITERDRVCQQLIEVLDCVATGALRQRDGQFDDVSVRLHFERLSVNGWFGRVQDASASITRCVMAARPFESRDAAWPLLRCRYRALGGRFDEGSNSLRLRHVHGVAALDLDNP